ncbi:hypothetical protein PQ478_08420 [Alkalihalophilus pseudofirmus]|uniref:hypothetical protein n=1 Tax=Alkalihalophilus pseudofirmus TaxID=79885 RepID=UPI00259B1FE6|nr:hypothetical protein [Alkalihalophilus pseudofirmus]WEG18492.1 hypothetical protein PQ478_08420 [Alkalihalophilus pseudofirmus]
MYEIFGELKLTVSVKCNEDEIERRKHGYHNVNMVGKTIKLYDGNGKYIGDMYVHDEDVELVDVLED